MTITINGTTGVAGVDGSASTPAYQGSDTNTGIAFPAADTVAIATGGTERLRITSAGNVGIGTTTPSAYGAGYVTVGANGSTMSGFETFANGTLVGYMHGYSTLMNFGSKTAIPLKFLTDDTERMRIDSSGNVGIGTSSPGNKLHVVSTGNTAAQITGKSTAAAFGSSTFWDGTGGGLQITNSETTTNAPTSIRFTQTGATDTAAGIAAVFSSISASNLVFCTNNGGVTVPERMRITSGGEVYIAGTTDQGAYNLQCNGTGVWGAGAYVNGSDARIKEDVAPIDSGLDVVEKLNPVTYRYKEDWSKDQSVQTGFIAQELLTALEGQNYVDGIVQQGGAEGYYSVAYQNIIPILTKAIQELNAKVEAQAAEIAALKGSNNV